MNNQLDIKEVISAIKFYNRFFGVYLPKIHLNIE